MQSQRNRSTVIDLCRGISMLLVIYGHAIEFAFLGKQSVEGSLFEQWRLIYSFHMSVFFFLSGVLHRNKGGLEVAKGSLALVLMAVLSHIAGALVRADVGIYEVVVSALLLKNFSLIVTWYLVAHAGVVFVAHLYQPGNPKQRAKVVITVIAVFVATQLTGVKVFQLQAIPVGLVFYGIGALASRSWGRLQRTPVHSAAIALAVLALAGLAIWLAPFNRGCGLDPSSACPSYKNQFAVLFLMGRYGNPLLFMVSSLAGIAVCFGVSVLLARYGGGLIVRALSWVGRNTITLLLINGFFFAVVERRAHKWVHVDVDGVYAFAWAVGLTVAQLAVAPYVKPAADKAMQACARAAGKLLSASRVAIRRAGT